MESNGREKQMSGMLLSVKKVRAVALLTALTVVTAACGVGQGGSAGGDGGDGGGSGDQANKVCMVPKLVGIPYFNSAENGAKEAADELGVELDYNGPAQARAADQVQIIDQMVQQQCDAITVASNDPEAVGSAMSRAQEQGVATSSWDADVPEDAREYFVNQATAEAIGQKLVDVMAEQTGGEGEFLVVTGSLTAPNQNAWIDEMKAYMEEEYPEMSIASIEPGEEDLQKGIDVTESYLQANPDTAGVFGITTVSLPGAAEAVQQLGMKDEVAVTGLGLPSENREFVKNGTIEQFILWNPADLGYLAVQVANAQVNGEMPSSGTFEAGRLGEVELIADDEVLLGPPVVFDKENIDEYDF
jgi:rhamnose ABC transporter rhamnose-binding protein